jgi:PPOX class probable F420-dependent enzyme
MLDLSQSRNAHIDQRLQTEPMIWLSSVKPNGDPHMVPVWFLWDGNTVLIFSQPDTQKMRNLQHNSHVMLALDTAEDGGDIVMLKGTAELDETANAEAAFPAYAQKYAQQLQSFGWTIESMAQSYSKAIRVTPTKFLGAV